MTRTGLKRPAFYVHFRDRHDLALRVVENLEQCLTVAADGQPLLLSVDLGGCRRESRDRGLRGRNHDLFANLQVLDLFRQDPEPALDFRQPVAIV